LPHHSDHCCRFIATLQDPYKQVQYNEVLKTLQEEHALLQDVEAALLEIKSVPTTSGRTSLVRRDWADCSSRNLTTW
jgi:hypothetical protein